MIATRAHSRRLQRMRDVPVEWRWDFGDESTPVTTTTPGGPYPDKSVSHVYTRLVKPPS